MKLTQKHIDKIICRVTGITMVQLHSDSQKRPITDARNLAMLKGKEYLKLSSLKLMKYYNKDSHTTILGDLKSAKNLIETNKRAHARAEQVDEFIRKKISYLKILQKQKNMHYRIRRKGIKVNSKAKTISIPPDRVPELKRSMGIIKDLGYVIQYSII